MQVWYVPDGQMMLEMAESLVTMAGHQRKVSSGHLGDTAKGKIYLSCTVCFWFCWTFKIISLNILKLYFKA